MRAIYNAVSQLSFLRQMLSTRSFFYLCRGVLILLSLLPNAPLSAQQAASVPANTPVLEQLVTEVRQLRLALERTSAINSRLQITLQRIQLQQNQVNRISAQLETLRNDVVRSETDQSQAASNLTDLESRIEQEQNPNTQKTLQSEQKYMKALVEQKSRVIQEQRVKEGELASSLQTEQGKLGELQTRLDALDKLIESPAQ